MLVEDIVESLGVEVLERSRNELRCLCPFHNDSKPSFNINTITGAWQCWAGCGAGRDIYSLVAKGLNISYNSAKLELEKGFNPQLWIIGFRKKLLDRLEEEVEQIPNLEFLKDLPLAWENAGGDYLVGRGFHQEFLKKFGVLHFEKENGIIIPINSEVGNLIGYLFRSIEGKKFKYSYNFKSSEHIFGADKLNKNYKVINVVEGLLDMIWCYQNGFENTVSTFTCHVSDAQAVILAGLSQQVNIMYDADLSGYSAARKAVSKLKELNVVTKIIMLPTGKDPNDCTKEEIETSLMGVKYYKRSE